MTKTLSPVAALSQSLEHARVHALPFITLRTDALGRPVEQRPSTEDDFSVFAMFLQPASRAALALGRTHSYVVVLRCEALACWLVYLDGEYGYRLAQVEAELGNFMRDLRNHRLVPPAKAVEAYGARL